jgi:hypothetical protein
MIKILDNPDDQFEVKIEKKAYNEGFVEGYKSGTKFTLDLFSEIEQFPKNWINLEDESPKEKELLLYYCGATGIGVGYYYGRESEYPPGNNHVFGGDAGWRTGDVTHWMYAPDLPL